MCGLMWDWIERNQVGRRQPQPPLNTPKSKASPLLLPHLIRHGPRFCISHKRCHVSPSTVTHAGTFLVQSYRIIHTHTRYRVKTTPQTMLSSSSTSLPR